MAAQLALFEGDDPIAAEHAEAAEIARRLAPGLRLGTSSWSFSGWKGIVYRDDMSEAWLAREGLRYYAQHPLLTTVGVDRSYYAPVPEDDFDRYASQLPEGFRCFLKAPATVTSAVVPGSDHRGASGTPNERFLSASHFDEVMGSRLAARFAAHTGAVMLEVPRVPRSHTLSSEAFCARLAAFFSAAPSGMRFAVELREAALFTPRYVRTLRDHGVAHVYNWWTAMAPLPVQARAAPVASMPQVIVRVMLPQGSRYDDRKRDLAPFDRIREVFPDMRRDVVALAREALDAGVATAVLVSNKAEGCAPRTVRALAEMLAG